MKEKVFLSLVLIGMLSCKKQDETAPIIDSFNFNNSEMETATTYSGASYAVQAKFQDDVELNQAKLSWERGNIFFQNEAEVIFSPVNNASWTSYQLADLSGKADSHDWMSNLPDSIDGFWELGITVIDVDGNMTEETKQIRIRDTSIPQFFWTDLTPAPTESGWQGAVGEQLSLNAMLRDDTGLDSLFVDLNLNGEFYFESSSEVIGLDYDLSQVALPTLDQEGIYEIDIRVKDINGNESLVSGQITISQ